jgi:hypothetical protein
VRGEGGGDTARPRCRMKVPAPTRCQQARREGHEERLRNDLREGASKCSNSPNNRIGKLTLPFSELSDDYTPSCFVETFLNVVGVDESKTG